MKRVLILLDEEKKQFDLYHAMKSELENKGCTYMFSATSKEIRFETREVDVVIAKKKSWSEFDLNLSRGRRYDTIYYTAEFVQKHEDVFRELFLPCLGREGQLRQLPPVWFVRFLAEDIAEMVEGNRFKAFMNRLRKFLKEMV